MGPVLWPILSLLLFAASLPLCAQQPLMAAGACDEHLSKEPSRCSFSLAPHQKESFEVPIEARMARPISVVQSAGLVRVSPVTDAASPLVFTNAAGLTASMHVLLLADGPAARTVIVENIGAEQATGTLEVGAMRAQDETAKRESEAEESLAKAETLRTSHGADADILAAYDRAISGWSTPSSEAAEGRALTLKANYLQRTGDPASALALLQRAIPFVDVMEPADAGNVWRVAFHTNALLSHYEEAREDCARALVEYARTGDIFSQEVTLENLAAIERMEGSTADALRDATRAAQMAESIHDVRGQLGIAEQIGAIYSTTGELEQAYNTYGKAIALLQQSPDAQMEAYVWSDMGVVYTQLGDYARAQDALDHANRVWTQSPDPYGQINTLDDLGELMLAEEKPAEARSFYQRGLVLADKAGDRYRIYLLRGIGDSYLFEKNPVEAEKNYRTAFDLASHVNEGDSLAYLHCALGDAALMRGDRAAALEAFGHCNEEAHEKRQAAMQIRAQGGLARVAFESGDLDQAYLHCEQALAAIESQRNHLSATDLRTYYFASMHAYYDLDVEVLARLDAAHPGEGYGWKAFLAAERARARSLLDQLSGGDQAPAALEAQHDAAVRRLRALEAAAAEHRGRRSVSEEELVRLSRQERMLGDELAAMSPPGAAPHPLSLHEIAAALPAHGGTLLEYWVGEHASYVWAIGNEGLRVQALPARDVLERETARLRRSMLAEVSWGPEVTATERAARLPGLRRSTARLCMQLRSMLLPAGLMPQRAGTVLVVADGPLVSVPFAALDRTHAFLGEPSAQVSALLHARNPLPHPVSVAVFVADGAGAPGMAELTHAADEAATIRAVFGAPSTHLFSGASATPAAIRGLDWQAYSMAHFAAHASLNSRFAELNGLVAATPASKDAASVEKDRMLWYGDVRRLHLQLDLVVLSACDSSLGQNVPGEGLVGLSQAFLAAGSQRVLGSLWPVDDEATSAWMRQFYRQLRITRSPAIALRKAQQNMAASPTWSSPYYWAAFTLAGDWRPLP